MASSLLTAVLVLGIVGLRVRRFWYERHKQAFLGIWEPTLMLAMMSDVEIPLPELLRKDHWLFLKLWNHFQESMHGKSTLRLARIAFRLNCHQIARQLLAHGNRTERLFAILTLGHMRDRSSWDVLLRELAKPNRTSSLYAARALIQIAPSEAVKAIVPLLLERDDWELIQVTTLLQSFRNVLGPEIAQSLSHLSEARLLRALRLAEAFRLQIDGAVLLAWLEPDRPVEKLVVCLRLASGALVLEPVRQLAGHPDWRVRVQAARALGRLSQPQDAPLLIQLLSDAQWWVRYRAAQSLISLPFVAREQIQATLDAQPDRYAREIFSQVLAESSKGS